MNNNTPENGQSTSSDTQSYNNSQIKSEPNTNNNNHTIIYNSNYNQSYIYNNNISTMYDDENENKLSLSTPSPISAQSAA